VGEPTPGPLMLCGCDGGASGDQRWIHLCPLHTAAPDLLAAMENLLDNGDDPHPLSGRDPTVRREDIGPARAAIAKARGADNVAP
jgi:hypothetical protein